MRQRYKLVSWTGFVGTLAYISYTKEDYKETDSALSSTLQILKKWF